MALRRLPKRWKWTHHWLCLISHVSESPCLPAVWFLFSIFSHFTPFAIRVANAIGDVGAKRLADMLKVNTVLTDLFLNSKLCFDLYFRVCWTVQFPDLLHDCVRCDIGNHIGDDGIRGIAEALKVNAKLVCIDLQRVWSLSCDCFSFTTPLSWVDTVISKVAASYIVDALKVNTALTSMRLTFGSEYFTNIWYCFLIVPRWIRKLRRPRWCLYCAFSLPPQSPSSKTCHSRTNRSHRHCNVGTPPSALRHTRNCW